MVKRLVCGNYRCIRIRTGYLVKAQILRTGYQTKSQRSEQPPQDQVGFVMPGHDRAVRNEQPEHDFEIIRNRADGTDHRIAVSAHS